MATKKQTTATKVRVLVAGNYGKADDVAEISAEEFDSAIASGEVDANPAAVAYAESLKV